MMDFQMLFVPLHMNTEPKDFDIVLGNERIRRARLQVVFKGEISAAICS